MYCENCAKVVEGMENACWSCESPIEDSKPVNITEEEKEDLMVDVDVNIDIDKKKKNKK